MIKRTIYKTVCDSESFPYRWTDETCPTQIHRVNSIGYTVHVDKKLKYFPYEEFDKELGGLSGILTTNGNSEKD